MLGSRTDEEWDVQDVYFLAEQIALEEIRDADYSEVPEPASFGEYLSWAESVKSRNRKKHRGSRSKARAAAESISAIQVAAVVEQQKRQDAAVSGNSREFENHDSLGDPAPGTRKPPTDCCSATESEMVKGSSGKSRSTETEVYEQGGEEPILQRLQKVVRASVIPPVSEEDLESNVQEQADEILALEAIYGEDFRRFSNEQINTPSFLISINVEILQSIILWADHPSILESRSLADTEDSNVSDKRFVASSSGSWEADSTHVFTVQSLPPLKLIYTLPVSYPSHSPPLFILSSMWLNSSKLSKLCNALDNLWYEQRGQVIIYSWIEWLQMQALSFIGVCKELELGPYDFGGVYRGIESDQRASSGCISFQSDISHLLRHNEQKKNEEFWKAVHTCYICFTERPGRDVVMLPCQHKFCIGCMQTLATLHVREGSVNKLNCPDTSCQQAFPPYILRQLLEKEVFQRWEDLVLQRSLDTMMDIVYCPRCGTVCIQEEDNFVQCTKCFYTFCSLCMHRRHIGQDCMHLESRLRVLQERQGSKLTEEQRRKEQQQINEIISVLYVRREAKQCPKCKIAISKIEGCNKMVCSICRQFFCFKCGKKIDGYNHFWDGSCELFNHEMVQD